MRRLQEASPRHEEEHKHQIGWLIKDTRLTIDSQPSQPRHQQELIKRSYWQSTSKRMNIFLHDKRWHEGQFRAALALIHRTKQLNETEFYQRKMIIWQSVNAHPPNPESLTFVCADGPRRPHRCLTSSIPSITLVQTVQLKAEVFLYNLFVSFKVCLHQNKIKGWKIGSVWIDSNSSIDSSLLKHCSFILNATVWYCFCINTYFIMCKYVRLILISCSSLFTFSCYLVFLNWIVSALLHFAPHLSAYFLVLSSPGVPVPLWYIDAKTIRISQYLTAAFPVGGLIEAGFRDGF